MEFSKRLKQMRVQKKLSVAEVAGKAGVPPSSYQEWEQGRRILDVEVYFKLSQALGMTPGELMLGKSRKQEFAQVIDQIDRMTAELTLMKTRLLSTEI